MPIAQLIPSFNAGELSPLLDARTDIDKYASGCRELQNFLPTPYGPNVRRPGTQYLGPGLINSSQSRLIPFVFSETEAYVLELSNLLLRVWSGSGARLGYSTDRAWETAHAYVPGDLVIDPDFPGSGAVALCLVAHTSSVFGTDKIAGRWTDTTYQDFATPWLSPELRDVQQVEINDLMYFTHPLHPPQLLTRNINAAGDIFFRFVETPWDWPALLDENVTPATLTPSATSGSILITASDPAFFKPAHVGACFQIAYLRDSSSVSVDFSANHMGPQIDIWGAWEVTTYGTWEATLVVERSYDNGTTWGAIRSYVSDSDKNFAVSGNELRPALLRLKTTGWGSNSPGAYARLDADDPRALGLVQITAVNVTGPATLGTVTGITITNKGFLNTNGGSVEISGGGGTGAAATASFDIFGQLQSVTVTNPGSGYTTAPTVRFYQSLLGVKVYLAGVSAVATVGRDGAIVATANVIKSLYDTKATTLWSEGAWSNYQGFPRAIAVHQDRVMYAGTTRMPQSIWGTQLDDFQNFRTGSTASDGLFFTIASDRTSVIQWLKSKDEFLHVGRLGSEGRVNAADASSALSPADIQWTPTTSYGSRHLPAVILNDALLFVQARGRKVRALAQVANTAAFSGQDTTILSEHITRGEIVEYAAQSNPDSVLWCVRGDGAFLSMAYDSLSSQVAWSRHLTDGFVESVCVVPGQFGDDVWFSVRRVVGGMDKRYIERLSPGWREAWEDEQKTAWVYLDAAVRVVNSSASATVTGCGHLEGRAVRVLGDGADMGTYTVSDGAITLSAPCSVATVGLSYESILRPMKLEAPQQNGTAQGRKARICRMVVRLLKTLGGQYSTDGVNYADIPFRAAQDALDQSPPVFSGSTGDLVDRGNHRDAAEVWLKQSAPMPFTVLSIIPKWIPAND